MRGNLTTHEQTITVVDNIDPVIACPSGTYYREYDNEYVDYYTIYGSEFTPSVSDNCYLSSYLNSKNNSRYLNGYQLDLGDHAITWTATDASSNTDQCVVNVTVVETFEPIIECPDDFLEYTSEEDCYYTVSGTGLDAVFASETTIPGRTLTHDFISAPDSITLNGAEIPEGETTITWTAKQTIGGTEYTSTCSHLITIIDDVDPVIVQPVHDTFNIDPGECSRVMTVSNPSVADNCSAFGNLTIENNAPDTFLLGNNNVVWEITDESGNISIATQTITILDNEGPIIENCPTSDLTAIASGSNCQIAVSWPALIATDECSGMKSFTSTHSPGTLFDLGTTEVTYTAIDNNDNESTCTFNVIVTDENPTVVCVGDQTRNTNANTCSYKVLGNEFDPVSFSDNCAIDSIAWNYVTDANDTIRGTNTLSGKTIPRGSDPGETVINWIATDANGNTAECSFTLTINDNEPPIIVVPGNQVRYVDEHKNNYTVVGTEFDDVTATDNCGIVIKLETASGDSTLAGETLDIGENILRWYAEDDHGNSSEESFIVTVIDNEGPVLYTAEANTSANTSGSCEAVVNYTAPTFIDYGTDGVSSLIITVSPDTCIPGAVFPAGVTEVTYTAVDSFGNSTDYTFDVTVNDIEKPTIVCPSGSPFVRITDTDKGYYTTQGTEFDPVTFGDNCNLSLTVINDYNEETSLDGETFPVDTTSVIWIVTDNAGNADSCTIQVIVEDEQQPVIQYCADDSVAQNADLGFCSYEIPGSEYDPFGFSDNHGLQKLTYQIGSEAEVGTDMNTTLGGVKIPVGTTLEPTSTVTWRVYDLSGNPSIICQTVFTIIDVEDPFVQTVTNQIRSVDAGQTYYTILEGDGWDPTVTENCSIETLSYSIDGGGEVGTSDTTSIVDTTLEVGSHEIVWTATDIYGNTGTGSFLVTVIDDEIPNIVCNDITVYLESDGNYTLISANIDSIGSGTTDPGGIASMDVEPTSFNCTDIGLNPIVLTVADNFGNVATCEAGLTVEDTIAPTAICRDLTLQLDALGEVTLLASQINNGSADACGLQSVVADITSFTCSDVGDKVVTLTVTDVNSNVSTCTSNVSIEDNISPSAVCNPIQVYLDETGNYTLTAANNDSIAKGSADNCDLSYSVLPNTFSCSDFGSNEVTLRVTDSDGNIDECTTTVTVNDSIAPSAVCQDISIQLDVNGSATITADQINNASSDICGIESLSLDKTSFDCTNLGADSLTNLVTLSVTDTAGNEATCYALVTVSDTINPTISCPVSGLQSVNTDTDECTYTPVDDSWDASASDGCISLETIFTLSGATEIASNSSNTTLSGISFNKGTTVVLWTSTDSSGNSNTCSYSVEVSDAQDPNALCQDITVQLNASGNASITTADVDNGSNDACDTPVLSINISDFTCDDLGSNTVTLTATDASGNDATCESEVTIADTIDPSAVCKNITVYLDDSGAISVSGTDIDNNSSDNCGISIFEVSKDNVLFTSSVSYGCADVDPSGKTLYLKTSDSSANTDQCVSTVTVEDTISPVANCQDITIQLDNSGNASIVAADINNSSSDACGIQSTVASKTAFTCSDLGNQTVTLTITDNNSNVSSCDAIVTVSDTISPVYTSCPGNQNVVTDNGLCTYENNDLGWNAIATDNCSSIDSLYYTVSSPSTLTGLNTTISGQIFAKGTSTVTWTAKDVSGNTTQCVYTVTVSDNENPQANCQAFTAQLERDGTIEVFPSDIDNSSSDNCGITDYSISKDNINFQASLSYNCLDIGSANIYLQVIDDAGLRDTCVTTLTVADTLIPTLDDLSDRIVLTDNGKCYYTHSGTGWDPTDNCDSEPTITYSLGGATSDVTLPNTTLDGQIFEKGTTTVTWTVEDNASNTGTVVYNVVVNDNENPVISCPTDIEQVVASAGATSATVSSISAPTYSDNCSVDTLTYSYSGATTAAAQNSGINELSSDIFNVGTTTVTYIAIDAAGNSDTCTFDITINAQDGAIILDTNAVTTTEDLDYEEFKVRLGSEPTGTVVIDVTSSDTGEGTVDKATLTFDASNWDIEQTVRVTGVNDDVDDDDINYTITLSINQDGTDDASGFEQAGNATVNAINLDNDVAGVIITDPGTTTEDLGTATFDVSLKTEPIDTVMFTFEVDSGDLTEGEIIGTDTLVFLPTTWNIPQTITVKGKDDDIDDGDIPYTINVSNASSTLDTDYDGNFGTTVSITNIDNDDAGFIVSPQSLTTSETGTTAEFSIVLTSKPATDTSTFVVVVDIASNNTDEGTVDISQITFTHLNWDTAQTITVTGIDDAVVDGDIDFTIVNTVNTAGTTDEIYDLLNPDDVSVTNVDDDEASIAIDDVTQVETNSGTTNFVFTVTQSNIQVIGGYSVGFYLADGTAKRGSDLVNNGGLISFDGDANETQDITIQIKGDDVVEQNEEFYVMLTSPITTGVNQTINVTDNKGTGTINNDDAATFSIADTVITEGNSGTKELVFTVTLARGVETDSLVTIDYVTADGTAFEPGDYISESGTISFDGDDGETQTFSITIIGDEKIELDETFTATISNIKCSSLPVDILNQLSFTDYEATGTITNDDAAIISISDFEVQEDTASVMYTITLDKPVQGEFTIDFATSDNSALDGSDYIFADSTFTFGGANALVQTISIPIIDNSIAEPTETLIGTIDSLIDLNNQSITFEGGGASTIGTGTILDDDSATLAIDDVEVTEGVDATARFTVSLTGNIQDEVSFNYAAADISANSTSDYTLANNSITFESGSTTGTKKYIDVSIVDNNIAEAVETYYINLSALDNSSQSGVSIIDNQGLGTINDNDTVHLTLNAFTIAETNSAQTQSFYVSRDIASQSQITLVFTSEAEAVPSAISTSDFTAQSGVDVVLPEGSTDSVDVTATTIAGDIIAEPTETFKGSITFNNKNGQQVVFTSGGSQAIATITDNDVMEITLEDSTITETDGSQTINYLVTSNIAAQEDVILSFSTSNSSALAGNDYSAQAGTSITFYKGTVSNEIPVEILGDLITEPTELFTGSISLTNNNEQQVNIVDANANYTINDNDQATISIAGFTFDESDVGSLTAEFTIALSRDIQNAFTVEFATADIAGQAIAGDDYTAVSTTLTFGASNDSIQYVEIPIINDNWVEPTETLNGVLSNLSPASQAVTLSNGQSTLSAIGTITDDDFASIAIDSVTVNEDAGFAVFTVTLSGNIQDTLTVDYTTEDGTVGDIAVHTDDYTTTTGTIIFAAGSLSEATKTISVPIVDDNISEPISETFTVELSQLVCTGDNSFDNTIGLGTINDDDPITEINLTGFTVTETDGNVFHDFVASMGLVAQEDIVLTFTTSDTTALAGSDYTGQSKQYTITAGQLSVDIPIEVIGDNITEPQEIFAGAIQIHEANQQNVAIGTGSAIGIINDDDAATISITGFDVNESTGNGTFTMTSDHIIQDTVLFTFNTLDNTAKAGDLLDYTSVVDSILYFGDGNNGPINIPITIHNDDLSEPTESLYAVLSSLTTNGQNVIFAGSGPTIQATGTIQDNDAATLAIDSVSKIELDDGQTVEYEFTVAHNGNNTEGAFTVAYETKFVDSEANVDYDSKSGTIEFSGATGETQTISITVNGDDILEEDETFIVELSEGNFGGRNISFTDSIGLGTILDNDLAALMISDADTIEGKGVEFTLELTNDVEGDVTVDVSFGDVTTSSGDYTATTQQFTFTGGAKGTKTVTVPTNDDSVLEEDETFTASLSLFAGNSGIDTTDTGIGTILDNDNAALTISDADTIEGKGVEFTLELTNDVEGDVTVDVSFGDVTTSSGDYTATTQQFTFTGGVKGTKTVTVPTNDDSVLEEDETFTASLSLVLGNSGIDTTDTGTGTILDNDNAALTISDADTIEGKGVEFTLELTDDVEGDVTVDVSFGDVTTSSGDYTATTQQFTFTGGAKGTKTITVPTNDDSVLEADETFTASLSLVLGNSGIDTTDIGIGTILDNDNAALTISDADTIEGKGVEFTLELTNDVEGDVTVDVSFGDVTTSPGDYTATTQQFTFAGGAKGTKTVTVPTNDDSVLEADETFTASLSLFDGNSEVDDSDTGTGTILDNDNAALTISDADTIEGKGIEFTLELTDDVEGDVTVDVSFGDVTTLSGDYTGTTQRFIFAGGAKGTKTVTVPTNDDSVLEDDETFTASLSLFDGNTEVDDSDTGTGTILDNDNAALTISDADTIEGKGVEFTLELTNDVEGDVTVDVSFGDVTTSSGDYTATTQRLIFAGGAKGTKTVTVPTNDDSVLEEDETFTASLSLFDGNSEVDDSDTGTGTILDNDNAALTISDADTVEGKGIEFTLELTNDVEGDVTVDVSFGDVTTSSGDYTGTTQRFIFAGGVKGTKTVTVPTNNDSVLEADETFTASLSLFDGNSEVDDSDTGTGTILDNDLAALTISDADTIEGRGIEFTLELTDDVEGDVTVDVSFGDVTTSSGDYTGTTQRFIFVGGAKGTKTVTVPTNDDSVLEEDETFTASLSLFDGNSEVDDSDTGIGTILDNDNAALTISDADTVEGKGIEFTLELTNDVEGDVIVDVSFGDVTTSSGDYTATTQRFTFTGGVKGTKTVTVPTNDDSVLEEDETFTASLSLFAGNSGIDTTDTGIGTILDNDNAALTISDADTIEGKGVEFTLELTDDVEGDVTVDVSFGDVTTSSGDYTGTTQRITFTGGAKGTQTVTVPTNDDNVLEEEETFTASLSLVLGNSGIDTTDTGTGTILDNDVASVTIADTIIYEDDGTVTLNAILNNGAQGGFTVDVSTKDGTAKISDSDYTAITDHTLTFLGNAGEKQAFSFVPTSDDKLELDESAIVFMSNLANTSLNVGISDTAIITIANDDTARVTIEDISSFEDDGPVTFTATLDYAVQGGFTVDVFTSDSTAFIADSDYTQIIGHTLNFAGSKGETKTFSFTPTSDSKLEDDEIALIKQANLTGTLLNVDISDQARMKILNDDTARVSIDDVLVAEDAGTARFTVSLSGDVQDEFRVYYTVSDSTTSIGDDYTSSQNYVTFPAESGDGDVQYITIDIINDTYVEFTEYYLVKLDSISGASVQFVDSVGLGTITDNDNASISINDVSVHEDAGSATFTVTLSGNVQDEFTIDYATSDISALNGEDYTQATGNITFPTNSANGDMQTITVDITDDIQLEPTENYNLTLSNISGGLVHFTDSIGLGAITDNDAASISMDSVEVNEDAGIAIFTVTLNGHVQDSFSVDFISSDSTALAGSDYNTSTGTITFPDDSSDGTIQTISIPVIDDNFVEPDEYYSVVLSNITGGLVTIADSVGIGLIIDNDQASVSINNVRVDESDGNAIFTLTLTGNIQDAVSLDFETSERSAAEGSDFTNRSGTVTFPAGSTNGSTGIISVPIIDNSTVEPEEYFHVSLSNLVSTSIQIGIATSTGVCTITDDDHYPECNDITVNGLEDSTIYFSSNDFISAYNDQDGDQLDRIEISSLPENGLLYWNNNPVSVGQNINRADLDNLIFVPNPDWNGDTQFNYSVYDGANWSENGATVFITIIPVDDGPLAVDDTYKMDEDSEINGNIISNDISAMDSLVVVGINIGGIEYTVGDTILIPDVGRIIIKENGDFVFYPDTNFDSEVPIITYTVNDGNGGYDSAKISIKIQSKNDNPIVFNEFYKICIGSVLEGNVLSNGDYDPEGEGLIVAANLIKGPLYGDFSIEPDGSFEYASFGDQNGETDTIIVSICENEDDGICSNDTIIVQLPLPVELDAGEDISICGTGPVYLGNAVATGAITLRWTTSGDGAFSDSSLVNPVYIPGLADQENQSVQLILEGFGDPVCGNVSDTLQINFVNEVQVNAGKDLILCYDELVNLDSAFASGTTQVNWVTSGDGSFSDSSIVNPVYMPGDLDFEIGNVALILTGFGNETCGSKSDTIIIHFETAIEISAGKDLSLCGEDIVYLDSALVSGTDQVFWSSTGDGAFGDPTAIQTTYSPGLNDIENGNFSLVLQGIGGAVCGNRSDTIFVSLSQAVEVNVGSDLDICGNDSINLDNATSSGTDQIIWSTSGDGTFNDPEILNPVYTPGTFDSAIGEVTLILKGFGNSVCSDHSDTLHINLSSEVELDAGDDYKACKGEAVRIENAVAENYVALQWLTDGKGEIQDEFSLSPTYLPGNDENDIVQMILVATGEGACGSGYFADTLQITYQNDLSVTISGTSELSYDNSAILFANVLPESGDYEYLWAPEEQFLYPNAGETETVILKKDTEVSVSVMDMATGCVASDSLLVLVQAPDENSINVRNGLTPNGDGNNDVWYIEGIEYFPNNVVKIFNRWGDKIIEIQGYNNEFNYWDGLNEFGKKVPDGTYFYVVKVSSSKSYTGWVQVRSVIN